MISVTEAKQKVMASSRLLQPVSMAFYKAIGSVLAEDVISNISIPSFPQSSMDGYAILFSDKEKPLVIQDELPAGTGKKIQLQPGKAIKVFTGGPVPEGADTIVQKEWITVGNETIQINHAGVEKGAHIRMPGTDIPKGALAITKGTLLHTMHMGLLASIGTTEIAVIRKPSVAIVITGNELVQPGNPLQFGQVYESNAFALKACLIRLFVSEITVCHAKDTLAETESVIFKAISEHDMVLVTGGVSVGEYDHVAAAFANLGVDKHFHNVKQRPGKPLFFGTMDKKWVFGLPGNPASVLSCFYQYVMPLINSIAGVQAPKTVTAKLFASFEKKPPLTFFLKGLHQNGIARILQGQASFQLSSFAEANCWIELPETIAHFNEGDEVFIHPFI
ncbi:MAG: gephyrin-like molybdotransferase Glp [Bacteroidota bacterium]